MNAGLDPARIAHAARHPRDIAAYLELHIEAGGRAPEQAGLALGVVEAINGARRLNCRFTGEAGHAGTVPMLHRKDALAAAAEWMVQVENLTRQRGGNPGGDGRHPALCAGRGKRDTGRGAVDAGYSRPAGCAADGAAG